MQKRSNKRSLPSRNLSRSQRIKSRSKSSSCRSSPRRKRWSLNTCRLKSKLTLASKNLQKITCTMWKRWINGAIMRTIWRVDSARKVSRQWPVCPIYTHETFSQSKRHHWSSHRQIRAVQSMIRRGTSREADNRSHSRHRLTWWIEMQYRPIKVSRMKVPLSIGRRIKPYRALAIKTCNMQSKLSETQEPQIFSTITTFKG